MSKTKIETKRLDVRFGSTLDGIDSVCEQVKEILLAEGLEKYLFEMLLLVRESLVNAVEHGNEMDPEKCVKFYMELSDRDIVIEVEDEGFGFDWQLELEKESEVTKGYGRGLPIFQHYADRVRFNDEGNKVFLQKNWPQQREEKKISEVTVKSGRTIVKPQQDLVASVTRKFRDELLGLIERGLEELVVDLERIEMVDSDGLSALIAAHKQLGKVGKKLIISNTTQDIRNFFRIMRLDTQFVLEG